MAEKVSVNKSPLDRAAIWAITLIKDGLVALTMPAVLANTKFRQEQFIKNPGDDVSTEIMIKGGHLMRVLGCVAMGLVFHVNASLEVAAIFYAYGAAGVIDGVGLIVQSIAGDKPKIV